VRAVPDTFRADAAASAVLIDPTRSGERGRERPALVEAVQTAVVRRRKVRLVYANRAGGRTQRLVDPWGRADKDDVWYLVAGTEDGQRTFRVDRVIMPLWPIWPLSVLPISSCRRRGIGSASVRAELARIGSDLAGRYPT
jgi:hypothetical protein